LCVKISLFIFPVEDGKKKGKVQKVTQALYFTYSWGSPTLTDFHQILHIRRYAGHNHLCKFWFKKLSGLGYTGRQILGSPIEMADHPYNSAALPCSL